MREDLTWTGNLYLLGNAPSKQITNLNDEIRMP
jgi:hypothetical protein